MVCPACKAEIKSSKRHCFACGHDFNQPEAPKSPTSFMTFGLAGREYSPKSPQSLPIGLCIHERWSIIEQTPSKNGWAIYRVDDLETGVDRFLCLSMDMRPLHQAVFSLKNNAVFCDQESLKIGEWAALLIKVPTKMRFNEQTHWSLFLAAAGWLDALIKAAAGGLSDLTESNPWVFTDSFCFMSTDAGSINDDTCMQGELIKLGKRLFAIKPIGNPLEKRWLKRLLKGDYLSAHQAFDALLQLRPKGNITESSTDLKTPIIRMNNLRINCDFFAAAKSAGVLYPCWDMLNGDRLLRADRFELIIHGFLQPQTGLETSAINCLINDDNWKTQAGEDGILDAHMTKIGNMTLEALRDVHQASNCRVDIAIRIPKSFNDQLQLDGLGIHSRLDWVANENRLADKKCRQRLKDWSNESLLEEELIDICVAGWALHKTLYLWDTMQWRTGSTLEKIALAKTLICRIGCPQELLDVLVKITPKTWAEAKAVTLFWEDRIIENRVEKGLSALSDYEEQQRKKLEIFGFSELQTQKMVGEALDEAVEVSEKLTKELASINGANIRLTKRIPPEKKPLTTEKLSARKEALHHLAKKERRRFWGLTIAILMTGYMIWNATC